MAGKGLKGHHIIHILSGFFIFFGVWQRITAHQSIEATWTTSLNLNHLFGLGPQIKALFESLLFPIWRTTSNSRGTSRKLRRSVLVLAGQFQKLVDGTDYDAFRCLEHKHTSNTHTHGYTLYYDYPSMEITRQTYWLPQLTRKYVWSGKASPLKGILSNFHPSEIAKSFPDPSTFSSWCESCLPMCCQKKWPASSNSPW